MATTYDPIATITASGNPTGITFSSIPSTYTDLKLVCVGTAAGLIEVTFNSDTSTSYSQTAMFGNGSTATSSSVTSKAFIYLSYAASPSSTIPTFYSMDIFSYAGSTYKTCLITESEDFNGSGASGVDAALWRKTSAINTIYIFSPANLNTGFTATLYGIKSA